MPMHWSATSPRTARPPPAASVAASQALGIQVASELPSPSTIRSSPASPASPASRRVAGVAPPLVDSDGAAKLAKQGSMVPGTEMAMAELWELIAPSLRRSQTVLRLGEIPVARAMDVWLLNAGAVASANADRRPPTPRPPTANH